MFVEVNLIDLIHASCVYCTQYAKNVNNTYRLMFKCYHGVLLSAAHDHKTRKLQTELFEILSMI